MARDVVGATYLRAKFNSTSTCDWPYFEGPAHPGHAKCVRVRKRREADKRNASYQVEKTKFRKAQALEELVSHVNKDANANKRHRRRTRK